MSVVRTTCPYCGVGCGLVVAADGTITGDPAHPANYGRLCSKGSALAETLSADGRLLQPRIKSQTASWDAALDLVAQTFRETIISYGPDSVALYVSGQLLTEDYYVANKLMKGFIGSANIDTNSRLCMASTVAGHIRAFGEDVVPGLYEDLELADLVVLVGSNLAWCHPVLYQRLMAAREHRRTRIVTIDPRRTVSAETGDLHLDLRAGTDVALFAGLLNYLNVHAKGDARWIARHTTGIAEALTAAEALSVAQVAEITRLPAEKIETLYAWFAATERTVTVFSQGVNQAVDGTDKVNAIINCHLATGRIGRPGMGPFSVTGQPNAMGGREVGGFANQLAAHMGFDDTEAVAEVARFWRAPNIATRPGLKAIDMFDAIAAGKIKALWIMATNPAASLPRTSLVREALAQCPFVVVSDCWDTETTRFAHVTFPAAGWGEKNGTVTNSERRISRQRAFRAPAGDARPDWWIMAQVARRMGWADAFAYQSAADIFREHAALSGFNQRRRRFDISALHELSNRAYDDLEPLVWPLSTDANNGRMFASAGFSTSDGRARFVPTAWRAGDNGPGRDFPFVLNTGRIRDQWHTMTRTGRVPRLMVHQDEPHAVLSPGDAGKLGVITGDLVRIETNHGGLILPCAVSAGQRVGEAFVPMHWTDSFAALGAVNRLVTAAYDPVSGQPGLKATAARIAPVPTLWRGMVIACDAVMPAGDHYVARIPLTHGQAYIMRGWEPMSEAQINCWVSMLAAAGHTLRYTKRDWDRGVHAFAVGAKDRIRAFLFVCSGKNVLPDRDQVADLLDEPVSEDQFDELVSSSYASGSSDSCAANAVICSCFSVRANAIRASIAQNRLRTIEQISAALQAGSNCGSCVPELKTLLREAAK